MNDRRHIEFDWGQETEETPEQAYLRTLGHEAIESEEPIKNAAGRTVGTRYKITREARLIIDDSIQADEDNLIPSWQETQITDDEGATWTTIARQRASWTDFTAATESAANTHGLDHNESIRVVLVTDKGQIVEEGNPITAAEHQALLYPEEAHEDTMGYNEIAAILKERRGLEVPVTTLRVWLHRGQLPAPDHRVLGHPRWRAATIEAWLHRTKPEASSGAG